jgi:hypothetical protein
MAGRGCEGIVWLQNVCSLNEVNDQKSPVNDDLTPLAQGWGKLS